MGSNNNAASRQTDITKPALSGQLKTYIKIGRIRVTDVAYRLCLWHECIILLAKCIIVLALRLAWPFEFQLARKCPSFVGMTRKFLVA